MQKTWSAHTAKVQDLIISNIKADLARRIAARVKMVEIEPTEAPEVEDASRYEEELRTELAHSYDKLDVRQRKRRRAMGCLRDSSVELAGPLSPAVVYNGGNDDEAWDDEDTRGELGSDEGM